MATGGGPSYKDHDKKWPKKSPNEWRQQLPDSQSSEVADEDESARYCPDQELEQDLSDLSLHREENQPGLIIPGDEVSNDLPLPVSNSPSETESDASTYLSASEANKTAIFIDNQNKGAIPKTSTPKSIFRKPKSSKKINDSGDVNTPPINKYFCRTNRVGETVPSPVPPPNILDWYEAVDKDPDKYKNSPMTILGRLEPLPQRSPSPNKANKRKRINSAGKSITTATSKDGAQIACELDTPAAATTINNNDLPVINEDDDNIIITDPSSNIPWLLNAYPADKPLPESLCGKKVRFVNDHNNDNAQNRDNIHVSVNTNVDTPATNNPNSPLQEGDRDFLQIPEDAHPFFKRSRGCLSAASRADCRAGHLEEMVEREIALPWALRLEPIPAYLNVISPQLVRIQKRNAIALEREAAKLLRRSCTHLTTQGTLNWNIVAKFYGDDDMGLSHAKDKMDTMVARDYTREQDELEERKNNIFNNPVTNEDITNNLRIRGYLNPNQRGRSPTRAKPPQQPIPNPRVDRERQDIDNHPPPQHNNNRPPARGKRRRSTSRSRSRSPNRNRAAPAYRNDQRQFERRGRGRGRGQNRNRGYPERNNYYQGPQHVPDPEQLGAIIRQVVDHLNYPIQNRGRDYRR